MPGKAPAGRPDCRGTTKAGNPCKQKAASGSAYCAMHGGAKRKIGAPSKLTDSVVDAIVQAVKAGVTLEVAANSAGVNVGTLHRWREQGEADLAESKDTLSARLCEDLTRAKASGELALVRTIRGAGIVDWRAAAWLLERRAPERWSIGAKDADQGETLAPRIVTPAETARESILGLLRTATAPPAGAPTP